MKLRRKIKCYTVISEIGSFVRAASETERYKLNMWQHECRRDTGRVSNLLASPKRDTVFECIQGPICVYAFHMGLGTSKAGQSRQMRDSWTVCAGCHREREQQFTVLVCDRDE